LNAQLRDDDVCRAEASSSNRQATFPASLQCSYVLYLIGVLALVIPVASGRTLIWLGVAVGLTGHAAQVFVAEGLIVELAGQPAGAPEAVLM
jgi:hypothetical protein